MPDITTESVAPSNWSSVVWCRVVNVTGYRLTNVYVRHELGRYTNEQTYPALETGEYFYLKLNAGSGSSDLWKMRADSYTEGPLTHSYPKQCDIEYSDAESDDPTCFLIGPRNAGFSVQLPASSSCWGVSYDTH